MACWFPQLPFAIWTVVLLSNSTRNYSRSSANPQTTRGNDRSSLLILSTSSSDTSRFRVMFKCFETTKGEIPANVKCIISFNGKVVPRSHYRDEMAINRYCHLGKNVIRVTCNSLLVFVSFLAHQKAEYVIQVELVRCHSAKDLLTMLLKSTSNPSLEDLKNNGKRSSTMFIDQ